MTIYDRRSLTWRAPSPAVCLLLLLVSGCGLMFLPPPAVRALRAAVYTAVRPGLVAVGSGREAATRALSWLGNLGAGASRIARLEGELAEAQQRAAQLEAELVWAHSREPASRDNSPWQEAETSALIRPRLVPARVLGRQAQGLLQREGLLDAGSHSGLSLGDLVLSPPAAVVDRGSDGSLVSGQLVLSGGRVWGKIDQVQPRFSMVLRTTDEGYRELARVAQMNGTQWKLGPRGVLEGMGEPLCRLRHVNVTEAISVGQWVVSEGHAGAVEGRFLYGTIDRVEQPPGAAHWDIWVRPALTDNLPQTVGVLTLQLAEPIVERTTDRQRTARRDVP